MVHQGLVKTQVLFLYHCGILRAIARVALQPNPCGLTASKERSKRLHLRKSSVADIANDCAIYRTNAQHCCWQQIVERRRSLLRYSGDPKRYFCTFGEKEHTSKRVSIIAPDNAISKAQCATFTSLLRLSATNPLWYTKKTHNFVSLFNLHKGFCVLSHALPCN